MQLKKKARNLLVGGAIATFGTLGASGFAVAQAGSASAADTLPAYTANGFCTTRVINAGQPPIKGEQCSGDYQVNRSTYKFTQDRLGFCPRYGITVHLEESFISPPTGGDPTILVSSHAFL